MYGYLESWFKGGKKTTSTVVRPSGMPSARPVSETDFGGDRGDHEDHHLYVQQIESMNEKELRKKFEELLSDMNLNDDKREPLHLLSSEQKRQMLILQFKGANQETKSKFDKPQQYIDYLENYMKPDLLSVQKLHHCIESLRIALTNNTLTWVNEFGHPGMTTLFRVLDVTANKHKDNKFDKLQVECLRSVLKFTNNTEGLRAFLRFNAGHKVVAKCIDYRKPQVSSYALQILAALCLLNDEKERIFGTEQALEAITEIGEERNCERFLPITECISKTRNHDLWKCVFQFINALLAEVEDFDFRLHLRNEIVRNGLYEQLETLKNEENAEFKHMYDFFLSSKEDDADELNQRFGNVKTDMDDINDCFEVLKHLTLDTSAEPYFLSILQHLLFIRDDNVIKPIYYKIIEECVSQIVLHKSGLDPDVSKKRLSIELQPLFDELKDKPPLVEEEKYEQLKKELDKVLAEKEEALAKLSLMDGRAISSTPVGGGPPPPPPLPGGGPPPPPMPGMGGGPPPPPMPGMSGGPPPPPMPGMGPPPPPMPGMGPPPPPAPGMGPPPPPMMGGMRMPPPPMMGGGPICLPGMGQPDVLPHGLKAKKKWEVSGPLKKANWKSIIPARMSEKAFWVRTKEEELASNDILEGLAQRFTSKPVKKVTDDVDRSSNMGTLKKAKELKVLDPKSAQNISILLGGSLKHMAYDDIKKCILRCDQTIMTENVLEQLIQYLPPPDQLNQLQQLKDSYNQLTGAEQFCVKMSEIKRLLPRLKSMKFHQNYTEMVNDVRPDIVSATAACEEVKRSKKFAKILELVLLLGNYMNSGTRNAQAFGFEISFLTKLTGTKDIDNKQTLLHYIVETVERKFPELLNFMDEMQHIDRASRVSLETIQKTLTQMDRNIKNLENDVKNNRVPQDENDLFVEVMEKFAHDAREQCTILQSMYKKGEGLYTDLSEYFVFDKQKYPLEEFFTDVKTFKDSFLEAKRENDREREMIEKRMAREKADKERKERDARKKKIIDMNPSETQEGVMDSLLEALHTGSAFNREQKRKRAPRLVGADRRAQLVRSRSRTNVLDGRDLREILAS